VHVTCSADMERQINELVPEYAAPHRYVSIGGIPCEITPGTTYRALDVAIP
jgi:hypothetical protein